MVSGGSSHREEHDLRGLGSYFNFLYILFIFNKLFIIELNDILHNIITLSRHCLIIMRYFLNFFSNLVQSYAHTHKFSYFTDCWKFQWIAIHFFFAGTFDMQNKIVFYVDSLRFSFLLVILGWRISLTPGYLVSTIHQSIYYRSCVLLANKCIFNCIFLSLLHCLFLH